MGAEESKLQVKFDEDKILLVQISAKCSIHGATVQAVQMYKNTFGKDISVGGLKVNVDHFSIILTLSGAMYINMRPLL